MCCLLNLKSNLLLRQVLDRWMLHYMFWRLSANASVPEHIWVFFFCCDFLPSLQHAAKLYLLYHCGSWLLCVKSLSPHFSHTQCICIRSGHSNFHVCAQVHRAVLRNGERVVVKVQRPGLKRLFDIDLSTTWSHPRVCNQANIFLVMFATRVPQLHVCHLL